MKKTTVILQIYPSKKVQGDLIAFMPTGKDTNMVIIVDKGCENFPFAAPGQLWQMDVAQKDNENYGIGTLLAPAELECAACYDDVPCFQVFLKGIQMPILEINFPEGEYNAFLKGMIIMHIRKAGLGAFEKQVLAEFRDLFEQFKHKMEEASEVVSEIVNKIKMFNRTEEGATEVSPLDMLKEVWKYVKVTAIPDSTEVADTFINSGFFFKKGKFFQAPVTEKEIVNI